VAAKPPKTTLVARCGGQVTSPSLTSARENLYGANHFATLLTITSSSVSEICGEKQVYRAAAVTVQGYLAHKKRPNANSPSRNQNLGLM